MHQRAFSLPPAITELLAARNSLRAEYKHLGLQFTLDGNLVGDIGEALAAELFGVQLELRCVAGVDGFAADGRSVQVKAIGRGRGPAFRMGETHADHLLFFSLNFESSEGTISFNGAGALGASSSTSAVIGTAIAVPVSGAAGRPTGR